MRVGPKGRWDTAPMSDERRFASTRFEVLHGQPVIDQFRERVDPDPQMQFDELGPDNVVTRSRFEAFRHHRLIGDKQKRAGRDLIVEPGDEDRRCLHLDARATDAGDLLNASSFLSDVTVLV